MDPECRIRLTTAGDFLEYALKILEEENEMAPNKKIPHKCDIHTGYVVVLRNGTACMVVRTGENFVKFLISADHKQSVPMNAYNDELRISRSYQDTNLDIMEIYGLANGNNHNSAIRALDVSPRGRTLLWSRPTAVKMTVAEIAAKLGYDIEIVAAH